MEFQRKWRKIVKAWLADTRHPTKHDVKDIIKTFEDYLQILQTKTSRHQNVNNLEVIYYLRFDEDIMETCLLR